jgi:quinol monooxygenase YgiN
MYNILFYCTSKPGSEDAMKALLAEMVRVSRAEDRALSYSFHQQRNQPSEWMLYEQWRDKAHLLAHQRNMKKHFGDPPPGAQMPARLDALIEKWSVTYYDLVA